MNLIIEIKKTKKEKEFFNCHSRYTPNGISHKYKCSRTLVTITPLRSFSREIIIDLNAYGGVMVLQGVELDVEIRVTMFFWNITYPDAISNGSRCLLLQLKWPTTCSHESIT